jgi:hypothetical protein
MMAGLDAHAVYDELLDLLADSADVQREPTFRLSSFSLVSLLPAPDSR